MNYIVYAEVCTIAVNRNDIQTLLEFKSILVTSQLAVSCVVRKVERRTFLDFTFNHYIEDIAIVSKDTRGVIQVCMRIQPQCRRSAFGLVIGFVQLHTILLGIVGAPTILSVILIRFSPSFIATRYLAHHILQSSGKRVDIALVVAGIQSCAGLVCKDGIKV